MGGITDISMCARNSGAEIYKAKLFIIGLM